MYSTFQLWPTIILWPYKGFSRCRKQMDGWNNTQKQVVKSLEIGLLLTQCSYLYRSGITNDHGQYNECSCGELWQQHQLSDWAQFLYRTTWNPKDSIHLHRDIVLFLMFCGSWLAWPHWCHSYKLFLQQWRQDRSHQDNPDKDVLTVQNHQTRSQTSQVTNAQHEFSFIKPPPLSKSSVFSWTRELDHPNLCKFIGGCIEVPNIAIITEYCPKGSLNDVLLNEEIPINWGFRWTFLSICRHSCFQWTMLVWTNVSNHNHITVTVWQILLCCGHRQRDVVSPPAQDLSRATEVYELCLGWPLGLQNNRLKEGFDVTDTFLK